MKAGPITVPDSSMQVRGYARSILNAVNGLVLQPKLQLSSPQLHDS